MSEYTKLFERAGARYEAPSLSTDGLLLRRDRKRRNQRITAAVVGIVVFVAAIWVVTSGVPSDRTETHTVPGGAGTGPAETGPAETGPSAAPALVALPPEGAPPSSPEDGELVLAVSGRGKAAERALTHMYLYADGRLIWWREGVPPEGSVFEQRLTPEGVELLRSEVISSGLLQPPGSDKTFDDPDTPFMTDGGADPDPLAFLGSIEVRDANEKLELHLDTDHWPGDATSQPDAIPTAEQEHAIELLDARLAYPAAWLPASAWADQEIRTFVPSGYAVAVCYGGWPYSERETVELDAIPAWLPEPAQELLRAEKAERVRPDITGGRSVYCSTSELTTEETRAFVGALEDAGLERQQPELGSAQATFEYDVPAPDPVEEATIWIDPYLPHGQVKCIPCG